MAVIHRIVATSKSRSTVLPLAFRILRYKLQAPNAKYAPWYGVVLKAARAAVKIIAMLAEESRASR